MFMIYGEVTQMDEKEKNLEPQEEYYVPRPWWQVAGAWIGLGLFILSATLLYLYVLRLF